MNLKCNFTNDNSGNFPGDVIRLVRYLKLTPGYDEIYALAKKEMAPVLLHAAAFDNLISRVALVKPYSSYRSVVMNRFYNYDFVNSFVARSLLAYDLPDLAALLAPRKLFISGITDGAGRIAAFESISEDVDLIRTSYQEKNADEQFNIDYGEQDDRPYGFYSGWIE